ncbi:Re/Si-specific NAD(P)(+) transhydrogenase subunit alpha [Amphibiibacter pelophylacis]|uniref:Re/Si-specific NAD(P)(+) transhydrogenase subunit alpha n=1 Tax=Amphibiibacter pelophylacis TaxID=1799477 RepID=A0ACC6P516_9BURK
MLIGVPKETLKGETRVAISPEVTKKLVAQGHTVQVEQGAGQSAHWPDSHYEAVGATVVDAATALASDMVITVRAPQDGTRRQLKSGAVLIGMLDPFDTDGLQALADAGVTAFALEAAPRISRAQSLDVLSSQANLAGYKAVMLAAHHYPKLFPMLMTAAGTIKAARVVVLGVGVAGLQAIATAKRLGAVIEASDVRPAVKEQVESLGGKFIDVPYETAEEREAAEGVGGYARPMPASWLERQKAEVARRVAQADIVITTALIPGRDAPTLVTAAMVESMKPGSVIVDMAAGRGAQTQGEDGRGGNCELSRLDSTVNHGGVTVLGPGNLPAEVPTDASALYARNVLDFLKLIVKDGQLALDLDDEIVRACLMTQGGALLRGKGPAPAAPAPEAPAEPEATAPQAEPEVAPAPEAPAEAAPESAAEPAPETPAKE